MPAAVESFRRILLGLAVAVLPDPERRPLEREVDAPLWSVGLGLVELFGGFALLVRDCQAFFQRHNALVAEAFLKADAEAWRDPEVGLAFGWSGMLTWFVWITRPLVWLLACFFITGLVRLIAFGLSRETVGEPLVFVGLRLWQAAGRRAGRARTAARRGPERPDRLLREGRGIVLLTWREQPGWTEWVTIEIGGRFFRLAGVGERPDGRWKALAYHLLEEDVGAVIRSLVRYQGEASRPQ